MAILSYFILSTRTDTIADNYDTTVNNEERMRQEGM
jgi:hypothetical protein